MKLAVMSDSHDNIWALDEALAQMKVADAVVHCGDLIAPFVIKRIGAALPDIPVHIVWGNNDGDTHLLTKVAAGFENFHLHGQVAHMELGGWQVGANHYPELAEDMARSGRYDLVCYGHDHRAHQEWVGETLLLNPGEIMGLNGRRSFAWVRTDTRQVEFIDL